MRKSEESEEKRSHRERHYRAQDTNGRLIMNLRDLSHTMRFLYEGRGSQKRIMIILNETGTITQRELTQRLGIKPGSASEVLAKLENSRRIARDISQEDRRTANITLTEKGKELAVEASEQRSRRHEEMFSCLTEDEKKQLLALLERVNEDWSERYETAETQCAEHRRHRGKCQGRTERD